MQHQTIVQHGRGEAPHLLLFCNVCPEVLADVLGDEFPDTTAVVECWGNKISSYQQLLCWYNGFSGWVHSISVATRHAQFDKIALIVWTAGTQVARDVCNDADWPDAIVIVDGLYGHRKASSRPDTIAEDPKPRIQGLIDYGTVAAQGNRILTILHSETHVPYTLTSSKEYTQYVQKQIENNLGIPLLKVPGAFETRKLDRLHIVEFEGIPLYAPITKELLFVEKWREWIPWLNGGKDRSVRSPHSP